MSNYIPSKDRKLFSFSSSLAKVALVLFIFFVFFGTSLPFRKGIGSVEDMGTSNIVNQIVYGGLFVISAIALIPMRKKLLQLSRKEKFLTAFLLWCLISLIWSDYTFVSFKRYLREITSVFVISAGLLHCSSTDEIIKYFKYILGIYLVISFISILLIPGAKAYDSGAWRGLTTNKNHLGQASLINIIFWVNILVMGRGKKQFLALLMCLLAFVLLLGSKSMTSIITLLLLAGIWLTVNIDQRLRVLNIGRVFLILTVLVFFSIVALGWFLGKDSLIAVPGYFGKDITFTGRTDLWAEIFNLARQHILLGCGYAGFWIVDNPNLLALYEQFVWLPRQAHMGYLDILNETGIVGLGLFLCMVIQFGRNLFSYNRPYFWKYIFLATLILNLQESTLFRLNTITGVMFTFAYLGFFYEKSRYELTDKPLEEYVPITHHAPFSR